MRPSNRALHRNPVPGRPNERIPIGGGGGGGGFNPARLPNPIYVLVASDATIAPGPSGNAGVISFAAGTCTLTVASGTIPAGYSGSTITIVGTGANDGAFTIRATTATTAEWLNPSGANYDFASGGSWSVLGQCTQLVDRAHGYPFGIVGTNTPTNALCSTPAANTSDVPGRVTLSSSYNNLNGRLLYNGDPACASRAENTDLTSMVLFQVDDPSTGVVGNSAMGCIRSTAINVGPTGWNSFRWGIPAPDRRGRFATLPGGAGAPAPMFSGRVAVCITYDFTTRVMRVYFDAVFQGQATLAAGAPLGMVTSLVMSPGEGNPAYTSNTQTINSVRMSRWGFDAKYGAILTDPEIAELTAWVHANA